MNSVRKTFIHLAWLGAGALALLSLSACGPQEPQHVQIPARTLFFEAGAMEDQDVASEAISRLETLVAENPGTRLGVFSYLLLADLYFRDGKLDEADTNYRLFLTLNSNSHLTSYALYQLMVVNFQQSLTGLFFPTREVDRDMEPNRRLILEFKRFFLLFPNSVYLEEVMPLHRAARAMLAEYELMVGDFYVDRQSYNSAIGRYTYLLRNFPEYPEPALVLEKLIDAYRANRQDQLADEMDRIYELRFGAGATEGAAGGQVIGVAQPDPQ